MNFGDIVGAVESIMGGTAGMKAMSEKLATEHGIPPAIAENLANKVQSMIAGGAGDSEIAALAEQHGVPPQIVEMMKGMIEKAGASEASHA